MSEAYREGYYEGWLAGIAHMNKLSEQYEQQYFREGIYLIEDGTLHGDSVGLAYCKAQEDCERYAYSFLQDWMDGRIPGDKPPVFPENIVDAE